MMRFHGAARYLNIIKASFLGHTVYFIEEETSERRMGEEKSGLDDLLQLFRIFKLARNFSPLNFV